MSETTVLRIAALSAAGPAGGSDAAEGLSELIEGAAEAGADLVLLPQLSFNSYFPAERNRDALELGERTPFRSLNRAAGRAGSALLFASVYECVGEGVFYARGDVVASDGQSLAFDRQRTVEASAGRYEQMFFSPGHGPRSVAATRWGPVSMLLGADARDPGAYACLKSLGAHLVLAGVSEDAGGWERVSATARGMATAHGLATAVVNRGGEHGFPGGAVVVAADGTQLEADGDGIYTLEMKAGTEEVG
jgi:predicted amidohydrolase